MQALAARFVAVADEVGRLQRGDDAECRFFRGFAEKGHYAGRTQPSDTRQGIYAVTAGGDLLASINTRDGAQVAAMLETALARYAELSPEQRTGTAAQADEVAASARRRFEALYPEDGLVLAVFTRDLPRPRVPRDWRGRAWNQDHAWFRADEVRALVPEAEVGAECAVPLPLLHRIVRCHLIDSVRGQTPAHREEDIRHAQLTVTTRAVEGDVLVLALRGRVRVERHGTWSTQGFQPPREGQSLGFDATLLGDARFDRKAARIVAFRLLAAGTRWGGTQFNGRHDDLAPAPMGVAFTLAQDGERTAPSLHWVYGWTARPRADQRKSNSK